MVENLYFELLILFILIFILFVYHGKYCYWKAKAESYQKQLNDGPELGWESEAHFWRMHFNKDAADSIYERFN